MNDRLLLAMLQAGRSTRSKTITLREAQSVRDALGAHVPDWYLAVLMMVPLAGTVYTYISSNEGDLIEYRLGWLGASGIIRESSEMYPGVAAIKEGFVAVAECRRGSGNPFFVRFADSEDPSVRQIFHDQVDHDDKLVGDWYRDVCGSLSELFENLRRQA